MNPLYMSSIVGGVFKGDRYLGSIDPFGTLIEGPWLVTGYAHYLCKPIITNEWNENIDEAKAKKIIEECFKVLYYRDCGAFDR